jgi:hypothetical protein
MKIRIKVNQPPCAHRILTLKGRYLTLKGIDLRRSRERYTCDACGKPVVRTLKLSVPSKEESWKRPPTTRRRKYH